jgi:hypothetical protein
MRKKIWILIGSIICAIAILHIAWLVYHSIVFGKYERITYDESVPGVHIANKNGETFSVSKIQYLQFNGNLGITKDNNYYLLVWPKLFRATEYGFMVLNDNTQTYYFYVDAEGTLVNEDQLNADERSIFSKNENIVKDLIEIFKDWTIAAYNGERSFFES